MRSVELFAGAGGLGLGLAKAGFDAQMVVEWDGPSCRTLRFNQARGAGHIGHWNILEADARTVSYGRHLQGLDLVSGGPPCQPFSVGGKHKGQADQRNMWPEAARAVRELAPRAFLFENVRGLVREKFAPYLEYVLLQLQLPSMGPGQDELWEDHKARLQRAINTRVSPPHYSVRLHEVDAADFGAAQRRMRVVVVGFRDDEQVEWTPPEQTHSRDALLWDQWISGEYWHRHDVPARLRPQLPATFLGAVSRLERLGEKPCKLPWRTVRDALAGLGEPSDGTSFVANHRLQPGARPYPGHTGSPLDWPAKALKAGVHGVPGGENMLLKPDGSVRYFSVREAARLQGFPDEYEFPSTVPWSEAMRQLGNAVPLSLAAAFGSAVANSLVRSGAARLMAA